jgi:hypothetical protein
MLPSTAFFFRRVGTALRSFSINFADRLALT